MVVTSEGARQLGLLMIRIGLACFCASVLAGALISPEARVDASYPAAGGLMLALAGWIVRSSRRGTSVTGIRAGFPVVALVGLITIWKAAYAWVDLKHHGLQTPVVLSVVGLLYVLGVCAVLRMAFRLQDDLGFE